MRKLFIALTFVGISTSAIAQSDVVPAQKYSVATNSFWANWYVSAGGTFTSAYTSQENNSNKNPFSVDRGTFGGEIAIGKWFTPGIGLRTKAFMGYAKQVNTRTSHPTYSFWNIHEDVTFNLSNLLFGYSETRVWNFIPYVGVGVVRNMSRDFADISYNMGILNNFRINSRWNIYAEVGLQAFEGVLDRAANDPWASRDNFSTRHYDKILSLSVGVTYNIGTHKWKKTPDVDALMAMNKEQMDALNASLEEQKAENARLRDMVANQKPAESVQTTTTKELITTTQSVFFNIGSSKIASRKDLVNVKEVAEYAKANNHKIIVTGYADSKTGSASFNQQLSEKRANIVVNELVKMGVNRDNIIVEAKGGVNTISPFSYNRRATVKLQ